MEFGGNSEAYALHMDGIDPLREYRNSFLFPKAPVAIERKNSIYLCGNSLGLQPKGLRSYIDEHLQKWEEEGVEGHFTDPNQWLTIDDTVRESMAVVVGAFGHEVVMMNTLTCNIHLMMIAFYNPVPSRSKVLIEKKAFPSDRYAVISQILQRGYDPASCLIELGPRHGESLLREEDILSLIKAQGQDIALVMFSGVQYFTGQLFDMQKITASAKEQGCNVGFDLAHAVGNVELSLHDWNIDFACWCSYKYLNCGPGSIGGCFVHEKHCGVLPDGPIDDVEGEDMTLKPPRLLGWWAHKVDTRFQMTPQFVPERSAYGYRLSNPSVLLIACVRASLDVFDKAGMPRLREKSKNLTAFLEHLILSELPGVVEIITPSDPERRGCQLSLAFTLNRPVGAAVGAADEPGADIAGRILNRLKERGVVCDARKPNILRVAPVPLYNSFVDVFEFVRTLKSILSEGVIEIS